MSDYCLDNQEKNECIDFTISPILGQPEQMGKFLNKKLSSDIKHLKIIPHDTIEFIRDCEVFFSIVFILQEKQKLVNIQYFKNDIKTLSESPMIMWESRKRIKQFSEFLKKKCLGEKILKNMFLISFLFGRIVEFLTIKHFAEGINWFPDRDSVMNIGKGIIKDIANISIHNALSGRANCPNINVGAENPDSKEFIFDPFIRYPDIITGVFSSFPFFVSRKLKEKHIQLLNDSILDNKRIVCFIICLEKTHCFDMNDLKFMCRKHTIRANVK